jgi:hypothetical protein
MAASGPQKLKIIIEAKNKDYLRATGYQTAIAKQFRGQYKKDCKVAKGEIGIVGGFSPEKSSNGSRRPAEIKKITKRPLPGNSAGNKKKPVRPQRENRHRRRFFSRKIKQWQPGDPAEIKNYCRGQKQRLSPRHRLPNGHCQAIP